MKLSTKRLCILGLLLALNVAISSFYIPVGVNLQIQFTFAITMFVASNFSLAECIIFSVLEDLLTYFIFQAARYPFFLGYTVSAVIGMIIYHILLKDKQSLPRIIISKSIVNIFINVLLGSIWSIMLYENGYLYFVAKSIVKNLLLLPIEIIIFFILNKALQPLADKYIKATLKISN